MDEEHIKNHKPAGYLNNVGSFKFQNAEKINEILPQHFNPSFYE
jgi:hypothetical protein